ncbi:uncharacterized protein LOC117300420 [Asterias rubens]|uniref:uncharacterized protein LOC117300420 n=1 Tax=Asterias rubens TaxID=7604 RepID=UPI0014550B65|nr:uncharacterized protein LOC117300420 [Asterias rubens]
MSNLSDSVFSRSPLSVITNKNITDVAIKPNIPNRNGDHKNIELRANICQENEKPFGHTDGEEEDDEEVFFGIVTTKEKSKMVKLRRKTQLFVSNFRDMLSEGSDESIGSSTGSEERSPTSRSTCQGISSSLNAQANNPANHPANHAALKIQRWFRHSRQERVFKEAMSEIQILDDRTDDILQKIRKEEERIRVCNTPTDSPAGHSGAKRFDARGSPALVIIPIHTPSLVETSPQQALQDTPSLGPSQLQFGSPTRDGTRDTDIVFDATEEDTNVVSVARPGFASVEDATLTPILFNKSTLRAFSTAEITHTSPQFIYKTTSAQRVHAHTPSMLDQTNLSKIDSTGTTSLNSSLSFVQSGSSLYKTSTVSSMSVPYQARTRVVAAFGGSPIPSKPYSLSYTPLTPHCTTINSFGDAGKLTLSTKRTQSSHLPHFNLTGTPSPFASAYHQGIQSPTVFSSPRLFPLTVQAVQSMQPLPSAVLFSPHKIPQQNSLKSESCHGHQEELVGTPKRSFLKDDGLVSDVVSPGLDVNNSFGPEPGSCPHPSGASNTLSRITQKLPMSPNVSVRKFAQKIAIITPRSKEKPRDERLETTPGKDLTLQNASQQPVSNQFFPSPVVMVRDLPTMIASSPRPNRAPASENSESDDFLRGPHDGVPSPVVAPRSNDTCLSRAKTSENSERDSPLRAPHGGVTSPAVGPRSNDTGRRKLELLLQKKAELARIRAQKAEIQQRLARENELCFTMKQEIQGALRSNTLQTNIPIHLLSIGCQGMSSLTLTEQELDVVTRLHTIRNSNKEDISSIPPPVASVASNKGSLHLRWHSSLVTEVHQLSSPSLPRRVAKPILAKPVSKARRVAVLKTESPAQRLRTRQVGSPKSSSLTRTPREKLAF